MQKYRLYFLERGHITAADAFDAVDDAMAIAYLETRRRGRLAELWCLDRIVRRYTQDVDDTVTTESASRWRWRPKVRSGSFSAVGLPPRTSRNRKQGNFRCWRTLVGPGPFRHRVGGGVRRGAGRAARRARGDAMDVVRISSAKVSRPFRDYALRDRLVHEVVAYLAHPVLAAALGRGGGGGEPRGLAARAVRLARLPEVPIVHNAVRGSRA